MGKFVVIAIAGASMLAADDADACKLLTPADISKTTGLTVAQGVAGRAVPGVLARCTWAGSRGTKVIVTLTDAQHMKTTIAAQEAAAKSVAGIGSKAIAVKGAAFNGGGYVLSALDAKGGFGVSILGEEGTFDRVVALAKVVASHR